MPPRIAIFHDNLAQMGGAERVTEALHKAFPGATLYSTLSVPERLSSYLRAADIHTTWMQWLPRKAQFFRHYFFLYPFAVEWVDLSAYDVVITSCFGFAKGIRCREDALQVCYCHTPMRWVWRASDYFAKENIGVIRKLLLGLALKPLRRWELRAAKRPDYYIANSQVVAQRLRDAFGVESVVISPPIETARFEASETIENYFLVLSRLVPYKRLDLAIQAATRLAVPLKVVGSGPDLKRLRGLAGPSVEFLGRQPDEAVSRLVSRCQALIFPGEEDFGMAPLEVNAAGRPVIAFYGGGAVETIREGVNGMFFLEPTVDSLIEAMCRFRLARWNVAAIQKQARSYDIAAFQQRICEFVERAIDMRQRIPA